MLIHHTQDLVPAKHIYELFGFWCCSPFFIIMFLKKEVGIRKQFCASIVDHLSKEEEGQSNGGQKIDNRRITLAVEGNISSGKSTFLNWLTEEPLQVAGICEVM